MRIRLTSLGALTLLLTAIAALWVGFVQPGLDWRRNVLAKLESAQGERTRLSASVSRLEMEEAALLSTTEDDLIWTAAQTGEAYALIQAALTKAAAEQGIAFRSITPLPVRSRGDVQTAVVRVEFEADLAQFTGFLRDIEYTSPALPVERASVRRLLRPSETTIYPIIFTQLDIIAPVQIGDGS